MFRKLKGDGVEWDVLLTFLLFAYREAPAVATRFFPFDLMFGRHIRGPLYMLSETWVPEACRVTLPFSGLTSGGRRWTR